MSNSNPEVRFATAGQMKALTGRSRKFWEYTRNGRINSRGERIEPALNEGHEYIKRNERSVIYNVPLCLSFLQWGAGSPEHLANIEAYLNGMTAPSGRKAA